MKKIIILTSMGIMILAACNKPSMNDNEAVADLEVLEPTAGLSYSVSKTTDNMDISSVNTGKSLNEKQVSQVSTESKIKVPEKIKKTAEIDMTVEDYAKARMAIQALIKGGNAYIASENEQNTTYSISNTMVIRVINKSFDNLVGNVSAIAKHVNSRNVYMEDVTAEFIDITARLKTKKEVEERYLEILKRASKISDILEVEEKIRVIREEIEAKEGELKYLNDQVDYSTINLNFHQDYEYVPADEPGFGGRLSHAFGNGWKSFLGFLIGIAYTWPLWLFAGIGTILLIRFIKKRRNKK